MGCPCLFREEPLGFWGDIFFNIQPKRDDQVQTQGRTKRNEGGIDKKQPDPGRIDFQPFPQYLANPKNRFLKKMAIGIKEVFDAVHSFHGILYLVFPHKNKDFPFQNGTAVRYI